MFTNSNSRIINRFSMNRNQFKYIVIVLMLVDHIGYFLPPTSTAFYAINFISRLTAPTMALFIAEGYFYTRNVNKYMKRMFIFAIISYIPYSLCFTGQLIPIQLFGGSTVPQFFDPNGMLEVYAHVYLPFIDSTLVILQSSVILTLLLGLFSIYLWDKMDIPKYAKVILTGIIIWVSAFADWQFYLVLMCLIFYFLKNNPKKMWIAYSIVALMYTFTVTIFANPFDIKFTWNFVIFGFGTFLIPFFFQLYNGKPGTKSAFNKWFFYIFYPGHLLILGLIRLALHL